jgi:hypothetical protein
MSTSTQVQQELDAMIKTLGGPVKKEETEPIENKTDPVKDPVVEPEPEPEPEPDTNPEVEEEKDSTTDPVSPTEPEPPTTEEVDPKDQEILNLKAQLEELKAAKPVEKQVEKPTDPVPEKPIDFLNGLDFDEVTRDPEALNKFANQIYTKGMAGASEHVLAQMPSLIQQQVTLQRQMEKTREDFFKSNPDLEKFPKVVATVFGELQAKSPDKPFEEILKLTAPEVRTRLGLKPSDTKPIESKLKAPKLPSGGGKGGRPTGEPIKENSLVSEIAAMNKVMK